MRPRPSKGPRGLPLGSDPKASITLLGVLNSVVHVFGLLAPALDPAQPTVSIPRGQGQPPEPFLSWALRTSPEPAHIEQGACQPSQGTVVLLVGNFDGCNFPTQPIFILYLVSLTSEAQV